MSHRLLSSVSNEQVQGFGFSHQRVLKNLARLTLTSRGGAEKGKLSPCHFRKKGRQKGGKSLPLS